MIGQHTEEPWVVMCPTGSLTKAGIDGGNNKGVSIVIYGTDEDVAGIQRVEDAERIVACVNACEGISSDYLRTHKLINHLEDK